MYFLIVGQNRNSAVENQVANKETIPQNHKPSRQSKYPSYPYHAVASKRPHAQAYGYQQKGRKVAKKPNRYLYLIMFLLILRKL